VDDNMSDNIHIRYGDLKDVEILCSFGIALAEETENKQLKSEVVSKGIRNHITDRDKGFYLVAECEDKTAGALMITLEWSDWRNGFFWWIQSVYVLPEFRRQGIFRKLYDKVKSLAEQEADVCGIRLYVDKDNQPALQTYKAMGMQETNYLLYELEF
jgi:ribosomal protein S18 acetylase RimI-like enzyme